MSSRSRASGSIDGGTTRYAFALSERPLRVAEPGDGAWRSLAGAMADGRTIAAIAADHATDRPTAALVCRPARAMPPDIESTPERDLGVDQSNTSVVLGEQVVLKAYRRIQSGLNPDLELTAFLTEEAGFAAVPPLAGFAEVISARQGTATVAIAQAFVADGADLYESLAEALTAWILAPGEVTVEFATEVAADIGALTAGHACRSGKRSGIAGVRAPRRDRGRTPPMGHQRRGTARARAGGHAGRGRDDAPGAGTRDLRRNWRASTTRLTDRC